MVVKLIDIIFPIAPLPKDNKQRDAVIKGYEIFIRKGTKDYAIGLLSELLLLWFGAYSISHAYSTINITTFVCMLLPTLLYMVSLALFICCKFVRLTDAEYAKQIISLLCSFVLCISFINIFLGFLNYDSWEKDKNVELDIQTYLYIIAISAIFYYIGYCHYLKKFNKMMLFQSKNGPTKIGAGITGGLVSYFIVRNMTDDIFLLIIFPFVLVIIFAFSGALVNYRQYDNIQRAKKGMTFK